jgi:hypothetical protein
MRRSFFLSNYSIVEDLTILAEKSPMTASLKELIRQVDFFSTSNFVVNSSLRQALKTPVVAASDPWSDIMYQSIYLTDEDPDNRIILQEPPVEDPMTGILVLKAARLSGNSGMVYCGTPDQLKSFAAKLAEYETRSIEEDLDEQMLLKCLVDAAEAEGLKVIFDRLSLEHGGDEEEEEWQ